MSKLIKMAGSIEKFDREYVATLQKTDQQVQKTVQMYQIIVLALKIVEKVGFIIWVSKIIEKMDSLNLFDFLMQFL